MKYFSFTFGQQEEVETRRPSLFVYSNRNGVFILAKSWCSCNPMSNPHVTGRSFDEGIIIMEAAEAVHLEILQRDRQTSSEDGCGGGEGGRDEV